MSLVKTIIDDREIEVERDRWALDVAKEMGISIPTLCHHPALEPYGACRLCVVEVTRGKWTWLTTACDLPIREGLSIRTDTPAVIDARKMTLELLWAQVPEAVEIQEMARQLGVEKPRFSARTQTGKCILCGLCIRVCRKILGESAVCFVDRGVERTVNSPFGESSDACIGCEACVVVCPTGHISSVDDGPLRRMETWKTDFPLTDCEICGQAIAPTRHLEHIRGILPENIPLEAVCPRCRRSQTAGRLAEASAMPTNARQASTKTEKC